MLDVDFQKLAVLRDRHAACLAAGDGNESGGEYCQRRGRKDSMRFHEHLLQQQTLQGAVLGRCGVTGITAQRHRTCGKRLFCMAYYLGVDGGASKTAALVTDETGRPLGSGVAGPSNHLRVGIETAARNIERAVNKALVTADVASREIVWAYCGIAGADHPAHRQEVVDSLSVFFPRGNFTVDNDARIALTGAIGFGPGVV